MHRIDTATRAIGLFGTGKDGFRDSNLIAGIIATALNASFFNSIQEEIAAPIEAVGLTLDPNNNGQLLLAIQKLIEARVGDYALDTGTANAKVVALNPAIAAYTGDFTGTFKNAVTNTGACTINFGPSGVPLLSDSGGALAGGDLPAGAVVGYQYINADGKAYITTMVMSQSDSRYLLQNNPTLGLVETFADPAGARCRRYYDATGMTGMTYNGATINAEYMTVNNTSITAGTWAGRDVTGPCWAEVMTDAGQKLFYYAASAAAGTAPVWSLAFAMDGSTGYDTIVKPGTIIEYAGQSAPVGYLVCPTALSYVNVGTYPALAGAIGTTWGTSGVASAGSFVIGTTYIINSVGTTNFTAIGASANTVGTVFVATGAGSGTGTASTQVGLPWFPADYAAVQANSNVGTSTVGVVLAHTHTEPVSFGGNNASAGGAAGTAISSNSTTNGQSPTGGSANLAAGVRVLRCIKY